jgi:hypothetical protein
MADVPKSYRAGDSVEDYCRACKTDRMHTVIVTDGAGLPLRVSCGYCDSEHNYRGGPRIETESGAAAVPTRRAEPTGVTTPPAPRVAQPVAAPPPDRSTFTRPPMSDLQEFEAVLRRVIREEAGLTAIEPAAKWRGGTLVLRPGKAGLQEKTWPIDAFFHKIVMLRNRLRTLEQQVNAAELPEDTKVRLQSYVTGCYGSLTSFNLLFADEADGFKGTAGAE